MIKYEKIDKNTALRLALAELNKIETLYQEDDLLHGQYITKLKFSDGSRKGWSFAVKLDVPEYFEPNIFFVAVSDPGGVVDVIEAL